MCDDSFSDNSANAICREMGYPGSSDWVSGSYFSYGDIQESLEVVLDEVQCGNNDWDSCSYSTSPDCAHFEDVFLTCLEGKVIHIFHFRMIVFLSLISIRLKNCIPNQKRMKIRRFKSIDLSLNFLTTPFGKARNIEQKTQKKKKEQKKKASVWLTEMVMRFLMGKWDSSYTTGALFVMTDLTVTLPMYFAGN